MRDDDSSLRDLWCDCFKTVCYILVRKAVETVATNAFLIIGLRNREALGEFRMTSVKGCVEASHLQQLRLPFQDNADRGKIVGLVERSQRGIAIQPSTTS